MKLLIVDDHAILREGLAAILRQAGPDTVVLQAADGAEGVRMAEEHLDLDAVFLDLQMPGVDGMSAVPEFGRRRPELPVIVLSSSEDPQDVRRALALVHQPRDFETRKGIFGPVVASQILAMPNGIAVPCALRSNQIHHLRHVSQSLRQRTRLSARTRLRRDSARSP